MFTADEVVLRLWPVPTACGDARHAIRDFCQLRGLDGLADDAELMTSELVTNAIRYASTLITVVGAERSDVLVVGVVGDNQGHADLSAELSDPMCEHGRGLFVVDRLADDWGTTRQVDGTTVWFRLSLHEGEEESLTPQTVTS